MADTRAAVTPAQLAAYVQDGGAAPDYVAECLDEAAALVAGYVKPANVRSEPPAHVLRRAVLEVGAELYHRRASRNGVVGLDAGPDNFAPLRITRDPLKACYDTLRPYMKAAIA